MKVTRRSRGFDAADTPDAPGTAVGAAALPSVQQVRRQWSIEADVVFRFPTCP